MKRLQNATRTLIGCAFLTLTATGFAQVTEAWVARYNGPASSDYGEALAVDAAGNVYVTGYSYGGEGTGHDYATIKYESNGNQLWVARYNGPANSSDQANALAVDAAGNVYVTGFSVAGGTESDYAKFKYDSNGNRLWLARYNGPGNYHDEAKGLAVDATGNVYVTGYSSGAGTGADYATVKYDSSGNELWVARYDGPENGGDWANALAVDAAGNVYVTGESAGAEILDDYATIKYDTNGNQLWVARYNGPANSDDEAKALAVDAAGDVYVTGRSGVNFATVKYDTNGSQLWVARYNGPGGGQGNALAVDAAGNVYVTGLSDGAGTRWDMQRSNTIPTATSCGSLATTARETGTTLHTRWPWTQRGVFTSRASPTFTLRETPTITRRSSTIPTAISGG